MTRTFIMLAAVGLTLAQALPPDPPERGASAWVLTAPAGSRDGRAGNAHLREGDLDAAARRFQAGLERSGPRGVTASSLQNNLGVVHFEQGDYERAHELFSDARMSARTDAEAARAAYNAATVAAAQGDLASALSHYREALLLEPEFPEARHNYEVVARRVTEQPPADRAAQDETGPSGDAPGEAAAPHPEDGPDQADVSPDDDPRSLPDSPARADDEPAEQEERREDGAGEDGAAGERALRDGRTGTGGEMTREEAERILRAIESEEQDALRDMQQRRSRAGSNERDW